MDSKRKKHAKKETQSETFVNAARSLGCDEDPAHFDAALKKVAQHKPAKDSGDGALKASGAKPSKKVR